MGETPADPDAPTQLGDAEPETQSDRAWGMWDDELYDPPPRRFTPGRITATAVTVSVLLMAGAAGIVWQHSHAGQAVVTPEPSMVKAVAPPAPVVVTVPPVTVTVPAPTTEAKVTPVAEAPPTRNFTPAELAPYDRQVCASLSRGESPASINQRIADMSGGLGMGFALNFTANAMIIDPKCRAPA